MLLEAEPGGRGDRVELREAHRRVARPPALTRYGLRALGEARQMGAGLAAAAQ